MRRLLSHDGLNQLTSLGGASISHDAKGNVTHDPTTGYSFRYSPENLLTTVTTPYYNGWLTYDGLNRLIDAGAGPSTGFSYDGYNRVGEYKVDPETGARTATGRYIFGPGEDEPLVSFEGPNSTKCGTSMRTSAARSLRRRLMVR